MTLVKYTPRRRLAPWSEFETFSNRISQLLGESWITPEPSGSWFPAVDVEETADEVILGAELPGMLEEDVHVEIENNILTVRGEKREERKEKRSYHVRERSYGSFKRTFTVPQSVQMDSIQAGFDNGILTVRMPKAPNAKGRRIEIGSMEKEG
ncbi:MAG: Hsp20/alpha crystallin family protein [Gemmatimonadota bacterium]|nr:Hsp20/alpha crystallin family protein [Gemmatimonadota bacterium]